MYFRKIFSTILISAIAIIVFLFIKNNEKQTTSYPTKYTDIGELVEEVEFSFDPTGKFWGERLFNRKYGNILCEAQVLTSIQTRVITNFMDLEIYCRDLT